MLNKLSSLSSLLALALAAIMAVASVNATATSIPQGKPFEYVANKESLKDFIRNIASTQGVPMIVSDKVISTVNGKFSGTDLRTFLDEVSQVFSLIWYYDGSVVYIYNADEIQNKVIRVKDLNLGSLRQAIESLGVYDQRYRWRYVPGQQMIYVSGPPRFVELVEEVAKYQSEDRVQTVQQTTNVQIFRLRYALAYDRTYSSRGKDVVIPGLASVLKSILGNSGNTSGDVVSYMGQGKDLDPTIAKTASVLSAGGTSNLDGRITADNRLNAIVINDSPAKMHMYKALIDSLDVPSEQVEISVSIMDVSTDQLEELGFDLKNSGANGSVQFGSSGNDLMPSGGATGAYGVQTIVASQAGKFLGKIKMLSEEGSAKIFSRPVVLTKDMVEAVVDNSNTFYVRIAGKEAVELVPITYGTMMRVTPRIVDEAQDRWIHMDINIEDGHKNGDTEVDAIPTVKKTTIATQSMIPNGDSLLIGGYIYSSMSEASSGVPILEDIPLIGYFFSWEAEESRQWVRLFMISPRTVTRADMLRNKQDTLRGVYKKQMSERFRDQAGDHGASKSTSSNQKAVQKKVKVAHDE